MRAPGTLLIVAVFAVVVGFSTANKASAGPSGFLCPSSRRLVSIGQSTSEVRSRCRVADDVRSSVEVRTIRETIRQWNPRLGRIAEVSVERSVPIAIEEWTYDFGRNRFTKRLRFENDRLVTVEEGAKGTADPED